VRKESKLTCIVHEVLHHAQEKALVPQSKNHKDLDDFARAIFKEFMEGKSFFVSQFPPDLQDLAESFFCFYLDKRIDSWASPLEEFSLIVKDRYVKREFESHLGKKVPKYRLERFLDKLTSTSHSGPETEEACA
jgi:hypothetical protein